jgi:hypothetical protein
MGNVQNKEVKQPDTTAILNSLKQISTNALLCGPDCQKRKTTDDLEQKYLNAQTNMITAPIELESAKKNYYMFAEGDTAYNNMLEKELKQKADKIGETKTEQFNEKKNQAKILNTYLNNDIINSKNTVELYNSYLVKNKKTETTIKNFHGDILTNDRKSYYEIQEKDNLIGWYNILLTSYYIIALVFVGTCLLKNNVLSNFVKLFIIILLIIFPYIIDPITIFILNIFKKVFELLPKNVYLEND